MLGNSQGANKKRTRADSVEEDEDFDPITDPKVKREGDNQKKRKVDSEADKWDSNFVKRLELQLEVRERQVAGLLEENNRVKQCYDESRNNIILLRREISQQKLRAGELESKVKHAEELGGIKPPRSRNWRC